MIRALKVVLVLWGAIHILLGLALIVVPYQAAGMFGFGEIADYVPYIMGLWGACFIASSVWVIAAGRDPLRHISWVKFAILWSILSVVVGLYSIVRGAADFSQVGPGIITDAVFAVAFLVFYPYRAARSGQ